ncbi:hypothetical protein PASE110613_04590 [Paenibacillus sediminis]
MAKSSSRKKREKLTREKGYDLHTLRRGGQNIQIDTTTNSTKTKMEKQHQNKHKKRYLSESDQINSAFILHFQILNQSLNTSSIFSIAQSNSTFVMTKGGAKRMTFS